MFGESNSASAIGPSRRGLWIGLSVGCLLLATAAVLVSGTVDGLNFFGARLADTTPSFTDAPRDEDTGISQRPEPLNSTAQFRTRASRPEPIGSNAPTVGSTGTKRATNGPSAAANGASAADGSSNGAALKTATGTPAANIGPTRPTPARPAPAKSACARPGYAALLDPPSEPVGTALARSLSASDLQPRFITLTDPGAAAGGAAKEGLDRQDLDRIMAGDGSAVTGQIKEGTLLVAQLKVLVRPTVIADSTMTEVRGTMDLAIVRNVCGTVTVQRHPEVFGRSVNETLEDGVRGLGEIFKEKIADLTARALVETAARKPR